MTVNDSGLYDPFDEEAREDRAKDDAIPEAGNRTMQPGEALGYGGVPGAKTTDEHGNKHIDAIVDLAQGTRKGTLDVQSWFAGPEEIPHRDSVLPDAFIGTNKHPDRDSFDEALQTAPLIADTLVSNLIPLTSPQLIPVQVAWANPQRKRLALTTGAVAVGYGSRQSSVGPTTGAFVPPNSVLTLEYTGDLWVCLVSGGATSNIGVTELIRNANRS